MVTSATEWRLSVGGRETTALFEPASGRASAVTFVCAHGAGGHMADGGMRRLAELYRARGLNVVRFNFFYRESRSSRPDPMPLLENCTAAVVAKVREEIQPDLLLLGGRSMGGRAASMLAARDFPCDGLILLAYPLHPAGRPEQMRDAHLADIRVPVLCVNGTRDSLCRRDLMEAVVGRLPRGWTMRWLEGADHSFHVLKSSGRTDSQVLAEIGDASEQWLAALGTTGRVA